MASSQTTETRESQDRRHAGGSRRRRSSRRPSRALPGTWRGGLWILVIAADFFLMSNPLVFVAGMDRALTLAALLTGSALVMTLPRVRAPRIALPVLVFLGWLLLSYTWSIQPAFTAAAWAQTAVIAAIAAVVYANVSGRVLVTGFVVGGAAVSVASIYAFLARLPGAVNGLVNEEVMAGIGTNTNILAYTLTFSLCGAAALVPRGWVARLAWLGAAALIGYGLVVADSATGDLTMVALVLTAALLIGYGPLTRTLLRTTRQRVLAMTTAAAVAVIGFLGVSRVLDQDLFTFADRTPLWSASFAVAMERPFVGYGYGAVWQHPWKPPLLNIVIGDIWDRTGAPLSHGHNSVVDLVVEVGFVGVVLMAVIMAVVGLRSAALLRAPVEGHADDVVMARFMVLCLVNLVLFGVTEPMATIPLGWWALVLLTEPPRRQGSRGESP